MKVSKMPKTNMWCNEFNTFGEKVDDYNFFKHQDESIKQERSTVSRENLIKNNRKTYRIGKSTKISRVRLEIDLNLINKQKEIKKINEEIKEKLNSY